MFVWRIRLIQPATNSVVLFLRASYWGLLFLAEFWYIKTGLLLEVQREKGLYFSIYIDHFNSKIKIVYIWSFVVDFKQHYYEKLCEPFIFATCK